ncbi:unnamed protein product [Amoebophrya sp. A25]|nr:unnamed protein product [Amoebophrya sp. A25]|eukprot:GSA25T00024432001.1
MSSSNYSRTKRRENPKNMARRWGLWSSPSNILKLLPMIFVAATAVLRPGDDRDQPDPPQIVHAQRPMPDEGTRWAERRQTNSTAPDHSVAVTGADHSGVDGLHHSVHEDVPNQSADRPVSVNNSEPLSSSTPKHALTNKTLASLKPPLSSSDTGAIAMLCGTIDCRPLGDSRDGDAAAGGSCSQDRDASAGKSSSFASSEIKNSGAQLGVGAVPLLLGVPPSRAHERSKRSNCGQEKQGVTSTTNTLLEEGQPQLTRSDEEAIALCCGTFTVKIAGKTLLQPRTSSEFPLTDNENSQGSSYMREPYDPSKYTTSTREEDRHEMSSLTEPSSLRTTEPSSSTCRRTQVCGPETLLQTQSKEFPLTDSKEQVIQEFCAQMGRLGGSSSFDDPTTKLEQKVQDLGDTWRQISADLDDKRTTAFSRGTNGAAVSPACMNRAGSTADRGAVELEDFWDTTRTTRPSTKTNNWFTQPVISAVEGLRQYRGRGLDLTPTVGDSCGSSTVRFEDPSENLVSMQTPRRGRSGGRSGGRPVISAVEGLRQYSMQTPRRGTSGNTMTPDSSPLTGPDGRSVGMYETGTVRSQAGGGLCETPSVRRYLGSAFDAVGSSSIATPKRTESQGPALQRITLEEMLQEMGVNDAVNDASSPHDVDAADGDNIHSHTLSPPNRMGVVLGEYPSKSNATRDSLPRWSADIPTLKLREINGVLGYQPSQRHIASQRGPQRTRGGYQDGAIGSRQPARSAFFSHVTPGPRTLLRSKSDTQLARRHQSAAGTAASTMHRRPAWK